MGFIKINNLTFSYSSDQEYIFKDLNLNIDSSWKLGLIGVNGKGKTTLMKIITGKIQTNNVSKNIDVRYFPFEIVDKNKMIWEIAEEVLPDIELWKLVKEMTKLNLSDDFLDRHFNELSYGEQTKILLAILFCQENKFFLLDEPTNHLDLATKRIVMQYLNSKKGYIIASHDRALLNNCVDYILSINNKNVELVNGNYQVWKENFDNQQLYELKQKTKLEKEVDKLTVAKEKAKNWSLKAEKAKSGGRNEKSGLRPDSGFVSACARKSMKKAKVVEKRINKALENKKELLQNFEEREELKVFPIGRTSGQLIVARRLKIKRDNKTVMNNINFELNSGERLAVCGPNGCGKSTLISLIMGEKLNFEGTLFIKNNLIISYLPQNAPDWQEKVKEIVEQKSGNIEIFMTLAKKMGLERKVLEEKFSYLSCGEKKKVMLALSLSISADIYVWDEPLNYLDIETRNQIEELIVKFKPTMLFVEHDDYFVQKVANKILIC